MVPGALGQQDAVSPLHGELWVKSLDMEDNGCGLRWLILPRPASSSFSPPDPVIPCSPHSSLAPTPKSLQLTHLLTLFPGDPGLPAHGFDKLELQFVEQGTLEMVLHIEEQKDGLFRALVILFHITGQVAGERHRIAGQEQDGKEPHLRSASKEGHRLIFTKDLQEPYQHHRVPPGHQEATVGQKPEGHFSHLDAEDRATLGGLRAGSAVSMQCPIMSPVPFNWLYVHTLQLPAG